MSLVCVLAVACLLWWCKIARGDDDIYSCENFQPSNFNISIGKTTSASESILYYRKLKQTKAVMLMSSDRQISQAASELQVPWELWEVGEGEVVQR